MIPSDRMQQFIDIFLHLDKHLDTFVREHGAWTYALTALIIFAETGLVVTPFLPGDSLLFAAGAIAARGGLDIWLLCGILIAAAIIGDAVNYSVGRYFAKKVLAGEKIPFIKKKHIDRTHEFYEKYGAKTIVLARFVPIVRTFAPFVAGAAGMSYRTFAIYNVIGAIAWVGICAGAGFIFGNIPFVQKNFEFFVLGIIFVSILPIVIEVVLANRRAKGPAASATDNTTSS